MAETSIEWTDHSINPLRARHRETGAVGHYCEKVSPGCAHCYSSRLQPRFGTPPFGSGQHRGEVETFLDEGKLAEVLRRKKPTKYFWCDMTDLFGDWVTNEDLHRCFAAMALTPHHTHQVLTKRAGRLAEFMNDPDTPWRVSEWMAGGAMLPARYKDYTPPWPPPSVWCGVSAEDQQRADERIPLLLKTPAAVRFLSIEPLLGPVDLTPWLNCPVCDHPRASHAPDSRVVGCQAGDGSEENPLCGCRNVTDKEIPEIHWVIVGGESGPGARPMHPDWARSLRDQCWAAGVAFFMKQMDKKEAIPADLFIRQFPEDRPCE